MTRTTKAMTAYYSSRMTGSAPLSVVFWRDMIVIGSSMVLLSLGLVVILALNGAPTWIVVAAYLINWPYSGFVVIAVWRAAARSAPAMKSVARAIALLWLAVALVV